jgi:phenylacetic acid degradation operon negative regulatory protein
MSASPRAGQPGSKMLIMDVCGAFMRPLGGWFPIATLVKLMSELGVDAAATRSALQRMKDRGLLDAETVDGQRGYRLSDEALPLLAQTDERIFGHPGPARIRDGWVLVSFSIPEQERPKRHVLRSRLSWLGFGNLSNGLWIAPHRMLAPLESTIAELGFEEYVQVFEARHVGFTPTEELARGAWDLDELGSLYAEYVEWARPVARRWSRAAHPAGAATFVDYTWAVYHWRKFPYLDPALPVELLPRGWQGARAAALFDQIRDRLEAPALDHVRSVLASA